MRLVDHKKHRIAVHPKWNTETRSWACDATIYLNEAGRSEGIPFFDPVRRYKVKASAVSSAITNRGRASNECRFTSVDLCWLRLQPPPSMTDFKDSQIILNICQKPLN